MLVVVLHVVLTPYIPRALHTATRLHLKTAHVVVHFNKAAATWGNQVSANSLAEP